MQDFNVVEFLLKVPLVFVPFLFALTFHEYAHGWVARKLGDNTAQLMGRLTLNPFPHIDIIGTVILPLMAFATGWAFLFGWAKPVPVNPRNLKNVKNDMFWIALAGPLSNVLLAVLGTAFLFVFVRVAENSPMTNSIVEGMIFFLQINIVLAIFNMIPLHPLDGGKVLARFLPAKANRFLEENQGQMQIALILLFVLGGFQILHIPIAAVFNSLMAIVAGG